MTFHQGCDVTVPGAAKQIALPMTRNGAVLDFRGPFSNGNGVDDLTTPVSAITRMPRATDSPLEPKMLNKLFLQHSTCLNEQAAVNGFVRHAHAEICSGDQSRINLLATIVCNFTCMARRHSLGRKADS